MSGSNQNSAFCGIITHSATNNEKNEIKSLFKHQNKSEFIAKQFKLVLQILVRTNEFSACFSFFTQKFSISSLVETGGRLAKRK